MPAAIAAAAAPALISALARHGLDSLGGFFNGAASAGASKVTQIIAEKTGIRVEDIADDKLTEAQWIALKEFELRNQELLIEGLGVEGNLEATRLQLAGADRVRATEMQRAALEGKDWFSRNFIYVFAIGLTLLAFAFIMCASFLPGIYEAAKDDAGKALGILDGPSQARAGTIDTVTGFMLGVTLSAIIQFFYGSSDGSSKKHDTIDRMLRQTVAEDDGGTGGN